MTGTIRAPADFLQLLPALLHLVDVGHVRHRAAGVEVGQEHRHLVAGQDVGGLGHEVDAAEHHPAYAGAGGCVPRQPEGVPGLVGEAHHRVTLIVMPQQQDLRAQRLLGGRRSRRDLLRCEIGDVGVRLDRELDVRRRHSGASSEIRGRFDASQPRDDAEPLSRG